LSSVSLVVLLGSALLQAITLAIHLQNGDMMGEPVEQSAGQALRAKDLCPFVKRQVAGDQSGAAFVALRDQLEE